MRHKQELQYSSMICVATKDSSRTKYEIKKEETTRGFLTKEEIRMLMDGKPKNAKRSFTLTCICSVRFMRLSFSNMRNLREENIRTYFDNHEWININRQKTGVESNIRLLDLPRRVIEKYRGLCEDGRIFPVSHYMACLCGIRAVARDITKHLTWQQSRHTAATTAFLSNGVPIETVSRCSDARASRQGKSMRRLQKKDSIRIWKILSHALAV